MSTTETTRMGTPVVPGTAMGPVIWPAEPIDLSEVPEQSAGPEREQERLDAAIEEVADRLRGRARGADGVASEVLMAQVSLVSDKGLKRSAAKQISGGASAEQAILAAVEEFTAMFAKVGGLMAERITDLRDLGTRVFAHLRGLPEPGITMPDEPSVLLADDLAPADTATLDPQRVVAIVTRLGGPTSHTAIIARQLGLPCIVAADIAGIEAGTVVLVDGAAGQIVIDPDPQQAKERIEADRRTREAAAAWRGPGRTSDGHDVAILANVQDGAGATSAAKGQAEGIGLFRTELAFLGNETEPTVQEQAEAYAAVLSPFAGRKVVIRTLDAGSDKPMKFANLTHEDNPALGMRGLRLSVDNPGLLEHQLDAIAQAAKATGESPWVMAPMVATADEARRFAEQVRSRGLTPGVMVEIPAAAIEARRILEYVDFLSIGTNDLAQYTMAADRLSPDLATLTDAWQPAVLELIAMTARAGDAAGKPVGVCGEAAADPLLACVLVGLGISSLSMAASAVQLVGASVSSASLAQCQQAAKAALAAADPADARRAASQALGR
ncbi:phosphoenolpyruvate--protein phosphotransferase [Epidermidibacterium keratini]|uniref:Phosphoenolpyruvate-protein phosphotransferase n=1 Tax=Epidermidibacterium keratini TaxID=1891644 RepID=A0A7L4YQH1_9ACTN|nr:phosphoenolpyruvate--protein phosphotransferase [Epidermidibacterium keratini]QHC01318.1 phosphoenolpyruvate--protein phosphotransferase [Epidermidibacterium keratini]